MKKEIGSEFWYTDVTKNENAQCAGGALLFMSGRTALDYVLKDIIKKRPVKSAYLPSYCCDSMIVPFLQNNINVEFYDVLINPQGGLMCAIDEAHKCDIVLIMNYFGFINKEIYKKASYMRDSGAVIIEDLTHCVFSELPEKRPVDYTFASLRKWTMLYSGGFACKAHGEFCEKPGGGRVNQAFVDLRKSAAQLKKRYFDGDIADKKFIDIFSAAEKELDTDYSNFSIDCESSEALKRLDVSRIRDRRRENGEILLAGLKECDAVKPVFRHISDGEAPLFIPVSAKKCLREKLRRFLIARNIYCPIHWPLTDLHAVSESAKSVYASELSIVCDQRYTSEEMDYILSCINEFGGLI